VSIQDNQGNVTSLKEKMEQRAGPEALLENSPFEVTDAAVKELMRSPLMRSPTSGHVTKHPSIPVFG
jgi:hypothetical protein